MSTKPADAGRFAVDGSDVDATNISTPSAGLRNTGFTLDYVPPSSEMNYLENIAYRWRQWLNDGDCAFHNLAATGTLSVTGATTLGSLVSDALTVGGQPLTFVSFTFTLTDPDLDGILTMHAVAHGRSTGDGPVRPSNSGGALPLPLSAGTDYWIIRIGPDDLILATSLINALAGTGIVFTTSGSGTQSVNATGSTASVTDATVTRDLTVGGKIHRTSVTTRPIVLAAPANSGLSAFAVQVNSGGSWTAQLSVPCGERISAVRARVIDSIGSATTIRARLYSSTDGTASAALATTNTSSGAGSEQLLEATGLAIDIVALKTYHATFDIPSGSGSCRIHAAEIDSFVP